MDTSSFSVFNSDVEIDALYVSSSSPNIAPAAAALLKHAGLSNAPSSNDQEKEIDGDHPSDPQRMGYDEFRLKFHWMRPHPSLVFSVENEFLTAASATSQVDEKSEKHAETRARRTKRDHQKVNPAVESSRLMDVYRSSQIRKNLELLATDSDCNNAAHAPDDELLTATNMHPPAEDFPKLSFDLPLEFPNLRINLASLVEPPLNTSWLPGGGQ